MPDFARRLTPILVVLAAGCGASGWGGMAAESHASGGIAVAADSAQGGETYQAAPENQLVQASQDALATFSLDVDTASYTLMRRDVTAGRLPVRDGVRVEEYVNFFRYDDVPATRTDGAPFGVKLESSPSPFGEGMHLLRVGVRAIDVATAQRPAANIVFLVDVSGSMQDANKLPLVQESLSLLVNTLRPDDTIGIVVYAGADSVLVPPTAVRERGILLDAIAQLSAGGSTNGAAGIRTAYNLAAQHFRRGGINRVILCTDGDFNVGATGDELISLIEQERNRGITLTTIGFGSGNYNDRDMERLADRGNGNYGYIDSRSEAVRMLARDLNGTLQVVAKDVKVQVQFDPAVVAEFRLVGYDNRRLAHQDFRNDAVDAGEVGSGQSVTALFEYRLRPGIVAGQDPRNLAEVRLRYKQPEGQQSTEVSRFIKVADVLPSFEQASPQMRFATAVAEYAEILRGGHFTTGRRFADVARIAHSALFSQDHDLVELTELVTRASRLPAGG